MQCGFLSKHCSIIDNWQPLVSIYIFDIDASKCDDDNGIIDRCTLERTSKLEIVFGQYGGATLCSLSFRGILYNRSNHFLYFLLEVLNPFIL